MTKCHACLVHSFEFYLVFFADDFPGVARTSLIQRDAAVETIVNNIVETILVNENCVNEVKIVSRCLTLLFCWPWLRLVPIEQLYLPLQISRGTVDLTNQHARNIHAMHYKFPIQTHDSQPSRFCSRRFLVNPVSKTHAFGHKIDTRCPTPCRCL